MKITTNAEKNSPDKSGQAVGRIFVDCSNGNQKDRGRVLFLPFLSYHTFTISITVKLKNKNKVHVAE